MGSNAQKILESRKAVNLALWFGRVVPERLGYAVVNSIVRIIARQTQWDAIRAARANQWVVSQGALSPEQLDQRVLDTFRFTGRAIFELNHNIHRPEAVDRLIRFDSRAEEAINHEPVHGAGSLIVSTHLLHFRRSTMVATSCSMKCAEKSVWKYFRLLETSCGRRFNAYELVSLSLLGSTGQSNMQRISPDFLGVRQTYRCTIFT